MSTITNDCLTRSGTGWFITVPIWQQWAGIKGLIHDVLQRCGEEMLYILHELLTQSTCHRCQTLTDHDSGRPWWCRRTLLLMWLT